MPRVFTACSPRRPTAISTGRIPASKAFSDSWGACTASWCATPTTAGSAKAQPVASGVSTPEARAIQRKLHQTIKRVSDDFQGRWHFNTCISAIMELVNVLYGAEEAIAQKLDAIPPQLLAEVQRNLVLLLAPFAPYLAHELWEMLARKGSLLKAPWPKYDRRAGQRRRDRDPGADQRQAAQPRRCAR